MRFLITLFLSVGCYHVSPSQQLIMMGSHPDPSVVKIGDTYWASTTSSNWFPAFPLLYSNDLINWKQKGYIFNKPPAWADYYFWAPEITYDSGRVYVYYTAHKRNGNLCLAVASADRPEGPYTDHGPLICQEFGSIDGFPIRDTSGKLFLIWKEDANSVGAPTPIWASEINEQRTALIGDQKELFRNEQEWEKELVEGVSIIRHGEYYYAFYAAAGCCGTGCSYVTGVARAKDVLGPWEKYDKNPILIDSENWICKGHGTPIEKDGRYYFLYHGYDRNTNAFTGREGLLQEFIFTPDGWIEFKETAANKVKRIRSVIDDFNSPRLNDTWQWSVFNPVRYQLIHGQLHLNALAGLSGSFVAQKPVSANYSVTTIIVADSSSASAGLAAIGDTKNLISALLKNNKLQLIVIEDGRRKTIQTVEIEATDRVHLHMRITDRYRISFFYSVDGKDFFELNAEPISGAFLPPWDSPFYIGLIAKGSSTEKAVFERFAIVDGVSTVATIAEDASLIPDRLMIVIVFVFILLLSVALAGKKIIKYVRSLKRK